MATPAPYDSEPIARDRAPGEPRGSRYQRIRVAIAIVRAVLRGGHRPRRVLDARCDDGLVALALARRFPGATVSAHDVDPERIAHARAARPERRVAFEVSDSLRLPYFDLDLATVCLDPADASATPLLVSLRNALARDGLVVVATWGAPADLVELAASTGFSRVAARGAPSALNVFELRR